jgi:preprotein translocase subunit YajC
MSLFIQDALAQASGNAANNQSNPLSSLLLMGGFILIFYFLLWRPQAKRAKEQRILLSALAKGDEVVTSGGLMGKISKITDDYIELMIANGVEIKMQKPSIVSLVPKGTLQI